MEEVQNIEFVESAHKAWSEFDPDNHVRLLGQSGAKVCVESNQSPARYIRAMNQMEKTSLYYLKSGKQEEAYVLLNKLITIYIEKLPAHPAFKNLDSKSRAEGKKIVNRAFPVAEDLKTNLTQKLQALKETSLQELESKRVEFSTTASSRAADAEISKIEGDRRDSNIVLESDSNTEEVSVESDSNTEEAIVSDQTVSISESEEQPDPTISPSTLSSAPPPDYSPPATAPLTSKGSVKQLVHSYSKLLTQAESVDSYTRTSVPSTAASPQKNDHRSSQMRTYAVGPMSSRWIGGAAPPPNPLFSLPSQLAATTSSLASPTSNLLSSSLNIRGLGVLRNVVIPLDIRQKFESLSHSNSFNKIETCGILCGVLRDSEGGEVILITHLVLPKQRGGPDSCDTLDEQELFEFQDKTDLITAGWIHTHPTQTAFLSSVDQHTHASYQCLLDEAVALVLAPKYDDLGVFSLTPHGQSYVNSCVKSGFHPHPKVPPLFDTCSHVHFASSLSTQVVDLR